MSPIGTCISALSPQLAVLWGGGVRIYGLVGGHIPLDVDFDGLKTHMISSLLSLLHVRT